MSAYISVELQRQVRDRMMRVRRMWGNMGEHPPKLE